MGITNFNPTVKQFMGKAYHTGRLFVPASGDCLLIEDVMTRLPKIGTGAGSAESRATHEEGLVTGQQVYDSIMEPFKRAALAGVPAILIADKTKWKPNLAKQAEQAKRKEQFDKGFDRRGFKNEAYPSDTQVGDLGVWVNGAWRLIDMGLLMASREVRDRLWVYVREKAQRDSFPLGARLIIDILPDEPPLLLHQTDDWHEITQYEFADAMDEDGEEKNSITMIQTETPLPEFYTKLGEGDVLIFHWIRQLMSGKLDSHLGIDSESVRTVVVHTTDTDTAAIAFMSRVYLEMEVREMTLIWNNSNTGHVDLSHLITGLKSLGWTRATFALFCVLSGCDYFEKAWCTNYVGHPNIATACHGVAPLTDEDPAKVTYEQFCNAVLCAHWTCVGFSPKEFVEYARKTTLSNRFAHVSQRVKMTKHRGRKPQQPPDGVDGWRAAYEWYCWIIRYWTTFEIGPITPTMAAARGIVLPGPPLSQEVEDGKQ